MSQRRTRKPRAVVIAVPARRRAAPRRRAVTGRGDYNIPSPNQPSAAAYSDGYKDGSKDCRKGFRSRNYGEELGRNVGGFLGGKAQDMISAWTGFGDYQIKQNSLLKLSPATPKIYNPVKSGGVIIRHREFLRDITTSSTPGAFSITNFALNPGQENTFPFLAQLAANYESYEFMGMIFHYRSMSADALNSTNTALGSVIMATEYDSLASVFSNKADMEAHEFASSCKPSVDMLHPIECARSQSVLSEQYIRVGAPASGSDLRMYDLGRTSIATVGFQAASVNIGELWVTYQVRLLKPRLYAALGSYNGFAHKIWAAYTNASPVGNGPTTVNNDTIGIITTGTTITFPISPVPQKYYFWIGWTGTSTVITFPVLTLTNCSFSNFVDTGNAPSTGNTTGKVAQSACILTGAGQAAIVTFGTAGILPAAPVAQCELVITQVDNNAA